jgi:hypothetical protein
MRAWPKGRPASEQLDGRGAALAPESNQARGTHWTRSSHTRFGALFLPRRAVLPDLSHGGYLSVL